MKAAANTLNSVATTAVSTITGSVLQARPAASVTMNLAPSIATEAAWRHLGYPLPKGGLPLGGGSLPPVDSSPEPLFDA